MKLLEYLKDLVSKDDDLWLVEYEGLEEVMVGVNNWSENDLDPYELEEEIAKRFKVKTDTIQGWYEQETDDQEEDFNFIRIIPCGD